MLSIESIVWAILYLIVGGVIFWLLNYAVDAVGIPEPFHKVARMILILGAVFVVIAVLLALAGHPIIRW